MHLRLTLALAFVAACSSNINKTLPMFDGSNNDDLGFNPLITDLAIEDGPVITIDLASNPDGPTVEVLSPMEGAEVSYDTLKVQARITPKGTTLVDANSVLLLIPSSMGMNGVKTAQMSLTAMANIYEGTIDITEIRGGPSEFSVVALDTGGRLGSKKVGYIHDKGPVITFVQPARATAKGSVNVEIIVDDAVHPLTEADAAKVQAYIWAIGDVTLMPVAGSRPLRMIGTLTFAQFDPPLDGPQIINAQATNSRNTLGKATKQFTVDNDGPLIEVLHPLAGQFVGGVITIRANVSDISEVVDASVRAVWGGNLATAVTLRRAQPGSNEFAAPYNVRALGTNFVLPSLSIRADDQLGNHSEQGQEIVVDNVPPIIEMDPPQVRVGIRDAAGVMCSQPFDPVGPESANDGARVFQIATVRARVEDQGNTAPGLLVERVSLVDDEDLDAVKLYAIPASNGAIAVDTDDPPDGVCDDVNPLLIPTTDVTASNEALSLRLTQILTEGGPDLRQNGLVSPQPTPAPAPCSPGSSANCCDAVGSPTSTGRPNPLCSLSGTAMYITIGQTTIKFKEIWTIPPVNTGDSAQCVGLQLDTLNRLPEGPTCIVTVARDRVGNHNVSPPLRVCIDRGGGMCSGWPPGTLPDCTGTYIKSTNTVNGSMKCTPVRFPINEVVPWLG